MGSNAFLPACPELETSGGKLPDRRIRSRLGRQPQVQFFLVLSALAVGATGDDMAPSAAEGPAPDPRALPKAIESVSGAATCYQVNNPFCCQETQALCDFRFMCHTGRHFVLPQVQCRDAQDIAPGSDSNNASSSLLRVLRPIKCTDDRGRLFSRAVKALKKDNVGWRNKKASRGWLTTREKVNVLFGRSAFLFLDPSEANPAHFIRKAGNLAVYFDVSEWTSSINEQTSKIDGPLWDYAPTSYPKAIDRVVLVRSEAMRKTLLKYGPQGYHTTVLSGLISQALELSDQERDNLNSGLQLSNVSSLLGGKVLLESFLEAATEQRPICFEHALLTANLKALGIPGGLATRHALMQTLETAVGVGPFEQDNNTITVLYLRRFLAPGKSRALTNESEAAFQEILYSLDHNTMLLENDTVRLEVEQGGEVVESEGRACNKMRRKRRTTSELYDIVRNFVENRHQETQGNSLVRVREVDMGALTFREQLEEVRGADIIISLHGAQLALASALAQPGSVVIEIAPYKVEHVIFEGMATNGGKLYMQHQCSRGRSQPGDAGRDTIPRQLCRKVLLCRKYYVDDRVVELSFEDLSSVEMLLRLALKFIHDTQKARTKNIYLWLQELYSSDAVPLCLDVLSSTDDTCRVTFLRSPYHLPKKRCILSSDM